MLQAENGERFKLLRVQLHDHAELRFLHAVPEIRLQHAVRRRRSVEQYVRRYRADPQKAWQGRTRDDHHPAVKLRGQEDGQDPVRRCMAGSEQDLPVRVLPVLEKRR